MRMDAMTAKNNSIPLFNGFVKVIVGLIILGYLFVNLVLGVLGVIEIICILGLGFRLSFVIDSFLPVWKFFIGLLSYLFAFIFMSNASSLILGLTLGCVFLLDCWQFIKSRSAE